MKKTYYTATRLVFLNFPSTTDRILWNDPKMLNLLLKYISSQFFETQLNEICSHLSEKASKGTFLKAEKLQNHSNKGKGEEKKKERGEGKEEKKKNQWLHS